MINSTKITDIFADVNETFPTVGRVGRIMGEFASKADGFSNKIGLDNTIDLDGAHI